jgi:hypothetical protein
MMFIAVMKSARHKVYILISRIVKFHPDFIKHVIFTISLYRQTNRKPAIAHKSDEQQENV